MFGMQCVSTIRFCWSYLVHQLVDSDLFRNEQMSGNYIHDPSQYWQLQMHTMIRSHMNNRHKIRYVWQILTTHFNVESIIWWIKGMKRLIIIMIIVRSRGIESMNKFSYFHHAHGCMKILKNFPWSKDQIMLI